MAARKGKGRQAVRNSSGGMPGWGWAVVGILVGAVLMFDQRLVQEDRRHHRRD